MWSCQAAARRCQRTRFQPTAQPSAYAASESHVLWGSFCWQGTVGNGTGEHAVSGDLMLHAGAKP